MTRQELEQIKALILQLSTKISSLPEATTLAGEDLFTIAKSEVGGAYTSKKMKMSVLAKTLKTCYPEINGSRFAGLASPRDEAFTPPTTTSLFWIAYTPGTYNAYGDIVVGDTPVVIVYDITTQQFSSLPLWEASSGTVKFSFADDTIVDNQVISQKIAVSYGNEYNFELNIQPTDSYEKIIVRQYNFNDVMLDVQEYDTIRPKVTPVNNASYIVFTVTYRDDNPVSAQNSYLLLTAPLSVLANDVYSYVSVIADKVLPDVWPFEAISGLPTTLEGYGITDAVDTTTFTTVLQSYYTKTESDNRFQPVGYYVQRTDLCYLHFVAGAFEADEFIQGITEKTIKVPTATAHLTNNGANGVNPFVTQGDIDASLVPINALIPNQASSENQLADKAFVNSSIATNTANFKGTYNSVDALANITGADANDYAFVSSVDTAGNTLYSRYKYSSGSWLFEYTLNNSSFTAAQWAAIQSGITSSLVTKLSALPTATELSDSLNTKVDKVTGKGLSTNDYTTTEKNKLAGVETGAQVNDIEHIKIGSTEQTISEKTVTLPASYPKADIADVAGKMREIVRYNESIRHNIIPVKGVNDAYRLDRIYGKTLAWNQLIKSGMSDWGTTMSKSISGDTITFSSAAGSNNKISKDPFFGVAGHKYVVSLYYTSNKAVSLQNLGESSLPAVNSFTRFVNVYTAASVGIYIYNYTTMTAGEWTLALKNFEYVDLTLLYGSEIDGMTNAQILAKFESEFPGYHEAGNKLISNDAESIETVGFNQWDEEWEVGAINSAGKPFASDSWIRSKNFNPIVGGRAYNMHPSGSNTLRITTYDSDKNFLQQWDSITDRVIDVSEQAAYFKVASNQTPYNHDICINLSDPAKNGTYEPYRKSVMQLGLNNLKVKSHNIWDEEWVNGYVDSTTGNVVTNTSTTIASVNLIPVSTGTYYFRSNTAHAFITRYDANKAVVDQIFVNFNNSREFSIGDNIKYIRFHSDSYGTTYNNDICINVSSSFNGQYEPHGDITITGGLKSAGSVRDEIVGNKYIKRVGSVDLGTLDWIYGYGAFNTQIPQLTGRNALVCSKYLTSSKNDIPDDGYIGNSDVVGAITLWVNDSAYTDAASFKAAMNGVTLYYELATPIEYELAEDYLNIGQDFEDGTMRVIPTSEPSLPLVADVTYGVNTGSIINWAHKVISEFKDKLEVLWNAVFNNS